MNLLFDFDGTLINSYYCVVEKTILLADEFKFKKIKDHEIENIRDLSSNELIKFLEIPIYKIPKLIYHMRKHLHNEMRTLNPIPNIQQTLKKLHDAKFPLGIVTSNSIENVSMWLNAHKFDHFFNFIHDESNYFSKKSLLKKTLKKYKMDPSDTFYICDETRDVDAAKQNNIKSIAVTWGYNSEKTLLKYDPTFIARSPEDILKICGMC